MAFRSRKVSGHFKKQAPGSRPERGPERGPDPDHDPHPDPDADSEPEQIKAGIHILLLLGRRAIFTFAGVYTN